VYTQTLYTQTQEQYWFVPLYNLVTNFSTRFDNWTLSPVCTGP